MAVRVSTAMHTAAIAAAAGAANGAKNAAFSGSIQTALGTNPVVKLNRTGSTVASKALVGSIPVVSNAFKISANTWANTTTSADADIDTGTWVIRVEKAGDSTIYLEGDLGKTGSGQPYLLSGDVTDALGIQAQDLYFQCPSFDTTTTTTTVQEIIDDMGTVNEAVAVLPNSQGWNQTDSIGSVLMGTIPSGNRLPSWALAAVNAVYETSAYWTAYVPWWVFYEVAGNAATNTRIEVRFPRTYIKYRNSSVWQGFQTTNSLFHFRAAKQFITAIGGTLEEATNSSGNTEIYFPPNSDFVIHGIGAGAVINPFDLDCIYSSFQARLVVRNAALADDRAQALYCAHAGGDFYPTLSTTQQQIGDYVPGAGIGKMKRVTSNWRSFNFATLTNASQLYQASIAAEDGRSGVAAMSPAAFALNPPPIL